MKNIIKNIKSSLNLKMSDFNFSPKKLIKRYKKVRTKTRRTFKKDEINNQSSSILSKYINIINDIKYPTNNNIF